MRPTGRSLWGWGRTDAALTDEERADIRERVRGALGEVERHAAVTLDEVDVAPPAIALPGSLAALGSPDPADRLLHARGNAFRDVVAAHAGDFGRVPDLVVRPGGAEDVARVLDWASDADVVVVPFGGGTSVVGGVRAPTGERPVVSLDLDRMAALLDVDEASRSARIQAGALGPQIEDQLRPHGFTLRHFPQSWEFSSLGGWLATRAGGHYATQATHIDDLTQAISAVTPTGRWSSRRLPGSGAGPSPDRLLLGSEGSLAVITDAWLRVQRRPVHRANATVRFPDFAAGAAAVRALAQSGLYPANCRLLDPVEAFLNRAGDGTAAVMPLAFESDDHALGPWVERALELCRDHGGVHEPATLLEGDRTGASVGGAAAWRRSFLRAPYIRDALIELGVVVETFETATTWERLGATVEAVRSRAAEVVEEVCGPGIVTVRITHAYPDGAAPYFTVLARGGASAADRVRQWDTIKAAVSEVIEQAGATITHHHAVGRDHRPWYDRQRPEPFAVALRAAKAALDPAGILNPGILV